MLYSSVYFIGDCQYAMFCVICLLGWIWPSRSVIVHSSNLNRQGSSFITFYLSVLHPHIFLYMLEYLQVCQTYWTVNSFGESQLSGLMGKLL